MGHLDLRQRQTVAGGSSARRVGGTARFLDDAADNPYLSFAAGFLLGIPASWASLLILFGGIFAVPFGGGSYLDTLFLAGLPMVPSALLFWRGVGQLGRWDGPCARPNAGGEKQLLVAISHAGSLTPVEAALETSLSVAEAEEALTGLADRGHLRVEGRDGVISYALPGNRR